MEPIVKLAQPYLAMVRAGETVIALQDWVAAKRARLEELLGSLTE